MAVEQGERRRLTADERRASIIAAARDVFARRGFHGVSTAELAQAAGCSEPMLYKHFASKQALFAAVVLDATACLRERFGDDVLDAPDPVAAYAERMRDAMCDPFIAQVIRLRSLAIALVDVPEIRDAVAASIHAHHAKARAVLALAQERGRVRADLDPDAAAWLVVGMALVGGARSALDGPAALADMPRVLGQLRLLAQAPADASNDPEGSDP